MKTTSKGWLAVSLLLVLSLLLVGCDLGLGGKAPEATEGAAAPEPSEGSLAVVDEVGIGGQGGHLYASVTGHYPDACTKISNVAQELNGDTFEITLTVAAPPGMMCATVLTPFTVDILLEIGGLTPGEYVVNVNDSGSATLTLGP
jgi:hypothetical protein